MNLKSLNPYASFSQGSRVVEASSSMNRPSNIIKLNWLSWRQDVSQVNSVQGIWAVSPRHVDLSFPGAFNKAIVSWLHMEQQQHLLQRTDVVSHLTCRGGQPTRLQSVRPCLLAWKAHTLGLILTSFAHVHVARHALIRFRGR